LQPFWAQAQPSSFTPRPSAHVAHTSNSPANVLVLASEDNSQRACASNIPANIMTEETKPLLSRRRRPRHRREKSEETGIFRLVDYGREPNPKSQRSEDRAIRTPKLPTSPVSVASTPSPLELMEPSPPSPEVQSPQLAFVLHGAVAPPELSLPPLAQLELPEPTLLQRVHEARPKKRPLTLRPKKRMPTPPWRLDQYVSKRTSSAKTPSRDADDATPPTCQRHDHDDNDLRSAKDRRTYPGAPSKLSSIEVIVDHDYDTPSFAPVAPVAATAERASSSQGAPGLKRPRPKNHPLHWAWPPLQPSGAPPGSKPPSSVTGA